MKPTQKISETNNNIYCFLYLLKNPKYILISIFQQIMIINQIIQDLKYFLIRA